VQSVEIVRFQGTPNGDKSQSSYTLLTGIVDGVAGVAGGGVARSMSLYCLSTLRSRRAPARPRLQRHPGIGGRPGAIRRSASRIGACDRHRRKRTFLLAAARTGHFRVAATSVCPIENVLSPLVPVLNRPNPPLLRQRGRRLMRRRGELIERSFAHEFETGNATDSPLPSRKHREAAARPRRGLQSRPAHARASDVASRGVSRAGPRPFGLPWSPWWTSWPAFCATHATAPLRNLRGRNPPRFALLRWLHERSHIFHGLLSPSAGKQARRDALRHRSRAHQRCSVVCFRDTGARFVGRVQARAGADQRETL
jgi:hypothetical protein